MNMQLITAKKNELIQRVTADGYQTTERDVAESQELVNQYIDELERLEKTATPKPITSINLIIKFILDRWYS